MQETDGRRAAFRLPPAKCLHISTTWVVPRRSGGLKASFDFDEIKTIWTQTLSSIVKAGGVGEPILGRMRCAQTTPQNGCSCTEWPHRHRCKAGIAAEIPEFWSNLYFLIRVYFSNTFGKEGATNGRDDFRAARASALTSPNSTSAI